MQITLREFQRNASAYLNKLPIILTQYEQPVAIVEPFVDTSDDRSPVVPKDIPLSPAHNVSTANPPPSPLRVEIEKKAATNFCKFCGKSPAFPHKYKYDDGTGDEGDAFFCVQHWNEYEKKMKPKITFQGSRLAPQADLSTSFNPIAKPTKKEKKPLFPKKSSKPGYL